MYSQRIAWYAVVLAPFAVTSVCCLRAVNGPLPGRAAPVSVLLVRTASRESRLAAQGAAAAAEQFGVDLRVEVLDPNDPQTAETVRALAKDHGDSPRSGIILCVEDHAPSPEVTTALAWRSRLVTLGRDAVPSKRLCHVGMNGFGAGRRSIALVHEWAPQGGDVLVLARDEDEPEIAERMSGVFSEVERIELIYGKSAGREPLRLRTCVIRDGESPADAIDRFMESSPAIVGVVTIDAQAAHAALAAQDAGRLGQLPIVAIDADEQILAAVQSGRFRAAIAPDAYDYGFEAVRRLAGLCRSKPVELPMRGAGAIHLPVTVFDGVSASVYANRLSSGRQTASARTHVSRLVPSS